jgi:blue copper oxidase
VQVTFSRFQGFFLYHCHILEHEDMGMMRNFRIA